MEIVIETSIKDFFKVYIDAIDLLKPVSSFPGNTKRVLATLMLVQYANKGKGILNTQSRKAIRKNLNISENSFNNVISELRKSRVLSTDNKINPKIMIYPDKEFILSYKFNIR